MSHSLHDHLLYYFYNSVQERLTNEIALAIDDAIKPLGVGVFVEAT